jgi:hypothetical protein
MFDCGAVPNMTFCGPARDTILTNQQTEKFNFDTNYITIITYLLRPRETVCFVDPRPSMFPEAKPRETWTVEVYINSQIDGIYQ